MEYSGSGKEACFDPPKLTAWAPRDEAARSHLLKMRKKHSKEHERRKESRDASLMKGTEELMAAGQDLEALEPSAESVQRLAELRLPSRDAERAVACWLGFVEVPAAAALLAEMEARTQDKDLRREVRRSLFKLQQRGIAAPPPPGEVSRAPVLAKEEDRGYVSHVDGRGDLVVWYVR